MRFRAKRQRSSSQESTSPDYYDASLEDNLDGMSQDTIPEASISHRQDGANAYASTFPLPKPADPREEGHMSSGPDTNEYPSSDSDEFFQVSIPTFSTGLTTFAYQRALRNRIQNPKLSRYGEYDMRAFTPTFVHDCLMLPGSLANVLSKVKKSICAHIPRALRLTADFKESPEDLIHRMTPALLPGFHAHVHSETQQPCLLQSTDSDYVQGMVIFGQGRNARDEIHEHYRPHSRRVKVQVEIDVLVEIPPFERQSPYELWRLQRRTIWVHTWLWSDVGNIDTQLRSQVPGWTLEDYLAGEMDMDQSMRVQYSSTSEEDGYYVMGAPENHREIEREQDRQVVYGGCGSLDYERVESGFAGW